MKVIQVIIPYIIMYSILAWMTMPIAKRKGVLFWLHWVTLFIPFLNIFWILFVVSLTDEEVKKELAELKQTVKELKQANNKNSQKNLSKVQNKINNKKYIISTVKNPSGVFETAVFVTNKFYLPKDLTSPTLVLNAKDETIAKKQHKKLSSLFEKRNPKDLKKRYIKLGEQDFCQMILGEL